MTDGTACPKRMEYGPCGGVGFDGSCEVGTFRCAFVDLPTVAWNGIDRGGAESRAAPPTAAADRMRRLLATRPILVADLSARPLSSAAIREVGAVLAGHVDAVLAGDSGAHRVQFPPAYRAALLRAAGLDVWAGVNCRDRNRVALEGELAALADIDGAGVSGVHCVTGDHTGTGSRPDAAPVFDLDSVELTSLATSAGHLTSVAESPAAPPTERRAERLVEKLAAGAEVCFVNHCGGAGPAADFVRRSRDVGASARFIGCVPLVVDAGSAALLATFTTLVLPDGFIEEIVAAPDPRRAGIDAAVRMSDDLLAAGFDGVDLSGGAGATGDLGYAEAVAEVADRVAVTETRE